MIFKKTGELYVRNCRVGLVEDNGTTVLADAIILGQKVRQSWLAGRQGLLHNTVITSVGPNVKRYKAPNRAYLSGIHVVDSKDIVLEDNSVDGKVEEMWGKLEESAKRLGVL